MARAAARVKVTGDEELARAFDRLGDRLDDKALRPAHDEAGEVVRSRASHLSPRDEGELADSVESKVQKRGPRIFAGGRDVPYAGPIHFGWRERNIEPQPFLVDALSDSAEEIRERYDNHLTGLIRRFDREAP